MSQPTTPVKIRALLDQLGLVLMKHVVDDQEKLTGAKLQRYVELAGKEVDSIEKATANLLQFVHRLLKTRELVEKEQ